MLGRKGFIYVIWAGSTEFVKIGFTTGNPFHRASSLQTGCPFGLTVVAYWAGTRDDEAAIHERFEDDCARGEWFWLSDELRKFIHPHAVALMEHQKSQEAIYAG